MDTKMNSDLHYFCFLDEVHDVFFLVYILHHLDSHGAAGGGDGTCGKTTIPDQ
jgi:hypothetical protein